MMYAWIEGETRPRWKPKQRWRDVVNKDLEELGLKDQWIEMTAHREEWRSAINKKEQARFEEDEKKEEARIKDFKCPSCEMKCKSHRGLMIHMKKKHPNVCEKCGREFKNSTGLLNHQRTCGSEDKRREKGEEESEWVSHSKQKRRRKSDHPEDPDCLSSNPSSPPAAALTSISSLSVTTSSPIIPTTETTEGAEEEEVIKCPFCGHECTDNRGLSSHLRFKHKVSFASLSSTPAPLPAVPLSPLCPSTSSSSSSSSSASPTFTIETIASISPPSPHEEKTTGKEVKCPYCDHSCADARGLSSHIRFKHKDEYQENKASKNPSTKKTSTPLSSTNLSSPSSDKGSFIPPRKSRSEPMT